MPSLGRLPPALRLAALLALTSSCARDRAEPEPVCLSWEDDIGPLLHEPCVPCHNSPTARGDYRLTSYLEAVGHGAASGRVALPGDERSRLLAALDPRTANERHQPFTHLYPQLRRWVVDCDLAYRRSRLHAAGIMDPLQADFHGTYLNERDWPLEQCVDCHGRDFRGGASGAACTTCHQGGPTACATCHGSGPTSGKHVIHLEGGALERPMTCETCHVTPRDWLAPGHIFTASGERDLPPAEVVISGFALHDLDPPRREGPPSFDPETKTCSNTYCHGAALGDDAGEAQRPRWSDDAPSSTCTSCHGAPPASHIWSDGCETCHNAVVSREGFVDLAKHLDGEVQLLDERSGCDSCHGAGELGAPAPDLAGHTHWSHLGVGAHAMHLEAPRRLSGPVACSDCHLVPKRLNDPGHIDTLLPAEVFPEVIGPGSLAFADGARPAWDRGTARCSETYCHGGGEGAARDMSLELARSPSWVGLAQNQVVCGSCHGAPPLDGDHTPELVLRDCHGCHSRTVDEHGAIIIRGEGPDRISEHIDGDVDL